MGNVAQFRVQKQAFFWQLADRNRSWQWTVGIGRRDRERLK